jgi:hypothetical protein
VIMDLIVRALAVSRLTRLLNEDYIMTPVRDRMEASKSEHLQYLATCPACASIWAGLLSLVIPRKLIYVLAVSEATVLVRLLEDRPKDVASAWGLAPESD